MKKILLIIILIVIVSLIPVFFNSGYILQIAIMVLLYAYWASSWNILGGYGGQMALGNGAFIGIGAYITASLFTYNNLSPWLGMIIAGFVAGMLSLIIGYACFKLKGAYFALASIAFMAIVRIVVLQKEYIFGYNMGGTLGMKLPWKGTFMDMQFVDKTWYFYIVLFMLCLVLFISNYISKSKMGFYLMAINTNQDAASSLGINVTGYKLRAQFISTFFLSMGGAIYAMLTMFIDPNRVIGFDLSIAVVLYTVVGGRATVWGPVLGAVLLAPANELLRATLGSKLSGLSNVMYGLLLMIIVYFMPNGIIIYIKRIIDTIKKQIYKKNEKNTNHSDIKEVGRNGSK